jgi:hypothetical protein
VAEGLTTPKKHPYGSLSILIKYSCILASRLKWFAFPFVDFAVVWSLPKVHVVSFPSVIHLAN